MKIPESFNQPLSVAYPTAYKVLSWLGRALIALNLYFIFKSLYATILTPHDPSFLISASEQVSFLTFKLALLTIAFSAGFLIIVKEIRHRVGLALLGLQVMHFARGAFTGLDYIPPEKNTFTFWFDFSLGFSFISIAIYAFLRSNLKQEEAA